MAVLNDKIRIYLSENGKVYKDEKSNYILEYDVSNADWEVDDDYLYDRVGDIAMDIDIEDQIHLGW